MCAFIIPPLPHFISRKRRRQVIKLCHPNLKQAIQAGRILDVGRTVRLGKGGTVCAPQLQSPVEAPWNAVIEYCVDELRSGLGESLHSVYLRGSVAVGHAFTDGRSDVDLVLLANSDIEPPALTAGIRAAFPFVRRVDIACHNLRHGLPTSTRFLLLAYCVHLAGTDVRPQLGCVTPSPEQLRNVRADARAAAAAAVPDARQWFLKRALRGLVDCVAKDRLLHARDLAPCVRILCAARPALAALAVSAAAAACSDQPVDDDLMADIADWAEVEFLRRTFGDAPPPLQLAPPPRVEAPSPLGALRHNVEQGTLELKSFFRRPVAAAAPPPPPRPFVRDELRPVAMSDLSPVLEVAQVSLRDAIADFARRGYSEPVVYRCAAGGVQHLNDTAGLVEELCSDARLHDVRIASGSSFTYCRPDAHVAYAPPSEVRRMTARDFLARLRGELAPLRYVDERVYLQSECRAASRIVPTPPAISLRQAERWWVCAHGAVSPLHYDAAHSALVQLAGTKRMLLLPPAALPAMRVYPLGHALHRRAMVDLGRPQAALFRAFWEREARAALEVVLRPGDALLFPAFWAHHTESGAEPRGLCAARTMRFVPS